MGTGARLVDLTLPLLRELFDRFEIETTVVRSSNIEFDRTDDPSENLARLVEELDGSRYVSGGRGYRNYLNEDPFDARGIDVTVQDWTPEWDDGNVCSLDVLFGADTPANCIK